MQCSGGIGRHSGNDFVVNNIIVEFWYRKVSSVARSYEVQILIYILENIRKR